MANLNIFKDSKLQYRFIIPIALCTLVILGVSFLYVNNLIERNNNKTIESNINSIKTAINMSQGNIEDYCLSQAALFTKSPEVIKAYKLALSGNINKEDCKKANEARQILKDYFVSISESFKEVTGKSRYSLHFHLPSARSLLRVWKCSTQDISDDISDFRETVKYVSKNHKSVKGIEIGRGGFAIRGIAPIFDESKQYVGSVEMLSDYNPLVLAAKSKETENLTIYMNASNLTIAKGLKDTSKNPQVGNFVMVTSTDKDLALKLGDSELLEKACNDTITQIKDNYCVTGFPIFDYSGKQVGCIEYIQDIKELQSELAQNKIKIIAGSGIFMLIMIKILLLVTFSVTKPLKNAINGLGTISSKVNMSSEQVTSASQELAHSVSEQAASIEEISSTMEEMSSIINENASNANSAKTLSSQAKSKTESGIASMVRLNESIGKIQDSSNETAKIIKTIDEIAFQTNLLALNAAVEAARAGEAGKGFAVVAEEVRNLATRSAEAARSTANLIQESVDNTHAGVESAEEVKVVFDEITGMVSQTSDYINQIAESSMENSKGISQIKEAIMQIDKATQSNSSGAEENASVSEELSNQAAGMKELVNGLRVLVDGKTAYQSQSPGTKAAGHDVFGDIENSTSWESEQVQDSFCS